MKTLSINLLDEEKLRQLEASFPRQEIRTIVDNKIRWRGKKIQMPEEFVKYNKQEVYIGSDNCADIIIMAPDNKLLWWPYTGLLCMSDNFRN